MALSKKDEERMEKKRNFIKGLEGLLKMDYSRNGVEEINFIVKEKDGYIENELIEIIYRSGSKQIVPAGSNSNGANGKAVFSAIY